MNLLFICSRNKWRSPTAETIFKTHLQHSVKSAGTSPNAQTRVSAKLINWAHIIFVMEKKHKQILLQRFPAETQNKQITVLYIPDDYQYMDEELIQTLKDTVIPYL